MGLSLSRVHHANFVVLVASFFVRPAPRAFFRPDRILPSPSRTVTVTDGACMGPSLSRVHHAHFVALVSSFFVRPAPRAFFRPDRILPSPSRTVTVTDGASSAPPKGLYAMIRGEPAIGHEQ